MALAFGIMAAAILACIPGIFGFLAWELKENWRLYRANEAANLQPRPIGSHGESVLRLLHPGFHSGTLPKLFAALRHAEAASNRKGIGRRLAELHHVQEAISHFVERSLMRTLAGSRRWQGLALQLGGVRLGVHSIRITLNCLALGEMPLVIDAEEQAGYVVAGLGQAGWVDRLSDPQRAALADALAGFYKRAGVDFIREQVRSALPEGTTWSVTDKGLAVRTAGELWRPSTTLPRRRPCNPALQTVVLRRGCGHYRSVNSAIAVRRCRGRIGPPPGRPINWARIMVCFCRGCIGYERVY